jgi:transcriptional regulator with XRE-family HTH domain
MIKIGSYRPNNNSLETGTSLMRNVKREKSLSSIGYDLHNNRTDSMQTMTIADSNTFHTEENEQHINSNRMSGSDDDDHGELQKEFETLMEENRKLKQQTQKKDILKRKISMLRKENETLKSTQEQQVRENPKPDSSEPHHSPKESSSKEHGVFAKSFLLTSTLGGLYIEPIDGSNGIQKIGGEAVPGGGGGSGSNSLSPTSYNNFISSSSPPSGSYLYKHPKNTHTTETQTMPTYAPHSTVSGTKSSVYHYSPRVKVATTEEDEEAHRFVQEFKARRIALKLTQSDIGEELNLRAGARYGQSYISRMESIQLSTAIVLRMKPLLEKLLDEKEQERRRMKQNMDFDEDEYLVDRKRKKRTNFTPEQSILMTKYFADQPRPSPQEIDDIARKIDVDRNSVKMWFNNKRQSEKFRANPLPGIGSINSVGSLNPYASPYGTMSSSFLMSGLMGNMAQINNNMNPIVTTSSLSNLKLDYPLNKLQPNTTLSLENVTLPSASQPTVGGAAPFVFQKDLNSLYNAETAARISNAVCNNIKRSPQKVDQAVSLPAAQIPATPVESAVSQITVGGSNSTHPAPSFTPSQTSPFVFNKEQLNSLYANARMEDSPTDKHVGVSDLAALYKERVNSESSLNGGTAGSFLMNATGSSPPSSIHHGLPTIKAISPPGNNPAFSLSQSLINRTLSQAALSQESSGGLNVSPKFSRTP